MVCSCTKTTVGLLFGGRSGEHEVSVLSARGVLGAINREKYTVWPIRIEKNGRWELLSELTQLGDLADLDRRKGKLCTLLPWKNGSKVLNPLSGEQLAGPVDVFFPLLHGVWDEDGNVQGFLTLADVAYVGSGVAGSAVGMDKILMKQVFEQHGLRTVPFEYFISKDWQSDPDSICDRIESTTGYPCFVKPANTGSSVGVTKVAAENQLGEAIRLAATLDRRIVVEKAIEGRELECGVLGNEQPEASVVGEIVPEGEFYDYRSKYQSEASRLEIPADIPEELSQQVRDWALRGFKAVDAAGLSRVDFFLEKSSNSLYINEINTIPGFTARSMYPLLWQASGVDYPRLVDRLIELALERYRDRATMTKSEEEDEREG